MDPTLILLVLVGVIGLCWVARQGDDDAGEYEEREGRYVRTRYDHLRADDSEENADGRLDDRPW